MKKFILLCLSFTLILTIIACSKQMKENNSHELVVFSTESISQELFDAIKANWDEWNSLTKEAQMLSSWRPEHYYNGFKNWEEYEKFVGFTVPNLVEKATAIGMTTPSIYCYGTEEGEIKWIHISSQSQQEDIKISFEATLYLTEINTDPSITDTFFEEVRKAYLEEISQSNSTLLTDSETTENYSSQTATGVVAGALCSIKVVGDVGNETEINEIFTQLIETFFH